ncbi:MAG: hypothetical protein J7M26_09815, partial [Armatimonadetes bacterium]|nr:hypothetical protein [Armatimonadota bacterium]
KAGKVAAAADYLSRAAALAGEPLVISRLAALSPLRRVRPETSAALEDLARAWEEGRPVEEATLAFLLASADEADVQAWVKGREGPASHKALLAGELALALGQPAVAEAHLREAPPGPRTWSAVVEALLRQGKPTQAEPIVAALLRAAPGPQTYALAAAVASQEKEWAAAAWWYACAIASGQEAVVSVAALARAASRAHLSDAERQRLAEQATAAVVAAPQRRLQALRRLYLALGLAAASGEKPSPPKTE